MLEFKDIKSEAFKKDSTSMQILYLFQDALRMLNGLRIDKDLRVSPQTCEVTTDSFKIIVRVYELEDLSFPVYWFSAQSAVYSSIRGDVRSRTDIEFVKDNPSFCEIVYRIWIDLPF